eukprot:XP_001697633.1 predicted protein [Chlamydomonas reinhardtii]
MSDMNGGDSTYQVEASRDEDLEVERGPAASSNRSGSDARETQHVSATEQAAVLRSASPGQELGILSSSSLPNLSCSPRDASCVSISTIADPRKDPSLSRQVREYMSQLVASGMRAERAAHIIQQWSGGGGVERVDLARLRRHFMTATLLPTLQQRLPSAVWSASATRHSLDSFLVLSAAAAGSADATGAGGRPTSASGRFDAVTELGLSAEEAAAAAVAYSRYGDSSRGGRIGDYELRRLLQEAGFPSLSPTELSLVLLLHDPDKKSWLSFRDWATWWAAAAA